jgi:hypothetical protein
MMAAVMVASAGTSACSLRGPAVERPPARTGAEVDPGIEWHVPSDAVPPPTMATPDSDGRVATQDDDEEPPLRGVDA